MNDSERINMLKIEITQVSQNALKDFKGNQEIARRGGRCSTC